MYLTTNALSTRDALQNRFRVTYTCQTYQLCNVQ